MGKHARVPGMPANLAHLAAPLGETKQVHITERTIMPRFDFDIIPEGSFGHPELGMTVLTSDTTAKQLVFPLTKSALTKLAHKALAIADGDDQEILHG